MKVSEVPPGTKFIILNKVTLIDGRATPLIKGTDGCEETIVTLTNGDRLFSVNPEDDVIILRQI